MEKELKNLKNKKPIVRYLKEMKEVLYDKGLAEKFPRLELYYVFRKVAKIDDLRYDITLIPPRILGKEFVRTKGNRNWKNFPELYRVLSGKAIFLLQKAKEKIVEDVLAIKAKKGDWVMVPPKYAVVMINPSKKTLKTGNWVSQKNKNIYKELEKIGGMSYFYTKAGWLKNKNYKKIPNLRFEKPLKKMPKDLDFLKA
ncbi:MAG: glucose-6-phosphate isomerase family protein [Patescibacteria group bacterium]|nr:glucose-6-phosphate isomerase family protein [Patescibacteria group bacterium]